MPLALLETGEISVEWSGFSDLSFQANRQAVAEQEGQCPPGVLFTMKFTAAWKRSGYGSVHAWTLADVCIYRSTSQAVILAAHSIGMVPTSVCADFCEKAMHTIPDEHNGKQLLCEQHHDGERCCLAR